MTEAGAGMAAASAAAERSSPTARNRSAVANGRAMVTAA